MKVKGLAISLVVISICIFAASANADSLNPSYMKPVKSFPQAMHGFHLASDFGHNGADFRAGLGETVYSVTDGVVIISGQFAGFGGSRPSRKGGVVIVKHTDPATGETFFAEYGHIHPNVKASMKVHKGQVIGKVAKYYDRKKLKPHLHFGVFTGSVFPSTGWGFGLTRGWADPAPYLEAKLGGSAFASNDKPAEKRRIHLAQNELNVPN